MKKIPDGIVDMILTDPPYGTTACKWDTVIPFEPMWEQLKRVIKPNGAIVMTASQPFTSALVMSNVKMFKYCWYWEKERLTNIAQVKKRAGKTVEECVVFYKNQPLYKPQMSIYIGKKRTNKVKNGVMGKLTDSNTKKVKEYKDNGLRYPTQVLKIQRDTLKSNLHPTQKPVALMEYLIKTYTNESETVLDFTMGSGTTGVACNNLNRNFIGIELDLTYFEIAKQRIDVYTL
jgi:site-specific DNA-methyltransferase (adenine-specific)